MSEWIKMSERKPSGNQLIFFEYEGKCFSGRALDIQDPCDVYNICPRFSGKVCIDFDDIDIWKPIFDLPELPKKELNIEIFKVYDLRNGERVIIVHVSSISVYKYIGYFISKNYLQLSWNEKGFCEGSHASHLDIIKLSDNQSLERK